MEDYSVMTMWPWTISEGLTGTDNLLRMVRYCQSLISIFSFLFFKSSVFVVSLFTFLLYGSYFPRINVWTFVVWPSVPGRFNCSCMNNYWPILTSHPPFLSISLSLCPSLPLSSVPCSLASFSLACSLPIARQGTQQAGSGSPVWAWCDRLFLL